MVGRTFSYPKFDPLMKFVVEKADVAGHMSNGIPPSYQHGEVNFQFYYEKKLSFYDVTSGFLVSLH